MSGTGKFMETESRLVVARGWEGGENEEWLFNGYGVAKESDTTEELHFHFQMKVHTKNTMFEIIKPSYNNNIHIYK